MTEDQRTAAIDAMRADGWRCYGVWVASLNPATIPFRALPHTRMQASYVPPEGQSLIEAKAKAKMIASGTVLSLSPQTAGFHTKVVITVNRVYKGQAANVIVIEQMSHLEPYDNRQSIIIVDADNAPLLLPDDSVFLFLDSTPQGLEPLSYTGTYFVRSGHIQALELNPFASKVNGLTEGDFAAAIANA